MGWSKKKEQGKRAEAGYRAVAATAVFVSMEPGQAAGPRWHWGAGG